MNTETPSQPAPPVDSTCRVPIDPFDASLFGEYARLILLGTAACSGIFWAVQWSSHAHALMMLIASILALAALATRRFAGLPRLLILSLAMIGLAATIGIKGDWLGPQPVFSPSAVCLLLAILALRDGWVAFRRHFRKISLRTIVFASGATAVLTYLVVVPTVGAVLEQFEEKQITVLAEELTSLEVLRIRTAKLSIFAVFAYCGACIGSFLNVAAASAPRGESIAFRSSACPQCDAPIRRLDNLPIVSYLMLQGRCRTCKAPIPIRYFAVELIGAALFAALFGYQLVTGAANVPGFLHYHFTGIVWIILYAKWPVIGIYFYHAIMFSCVLMFALMEWDGLRCPRWMGIAIISVFAALAIAVPILQPVAMDDFVPIRLGTAMPTPVTRVLTCLVGGLVGWLLAYLPSRFGWRTPAAVSLALLGVTLGWQATVTVFVIWAIISVLTSVVGFRREWLGPTAMLFVASMLHHPAWKWLTRFW